MTAERPDLPPLRPLWWDADAAPGGALVLLDQTRLPAETKHVICRDAEAVWRAIKTLQVRGAPAIGVAAAYGLVVGLDAVEPDDANWRDHARRIGEYLSTARPTAVNLSWAVARMNRRVEQLGHRSWPDARTALLSEAHAIRDEDAAMCRAIGRAGQHLIRPGSGVLTHCNAGALATSEYGTALAVMYSAAEQGRRFKVFVDETRPLLQGSRLTAWELTRQGLDTTLICDNMAAVLMAQARVNLVITGADRIAANGDTANKIGTYGVAVLAAAHKIPFYVAAPSSTFDMSLPNGDGIPIEERDPDEVRTFMGLPTAPESIPCFSPAFDVTPAKLLSGIITERGMIQPVTQRKIEAVLGPAVGR